VNEGKGGGRGEGGKIKLWDEIRGKQCMKKQRPL